MADDKKPNGQAPTDATGTLLGSSTPPAAKDAPADGAKPEGDKPPEGTPPADGKAGEGKPASEPASKDGTPPAAPKAPEKYELVVPKGAETFLNATDLQEFEKLAREGALTNEQAQEALNGHVDRIATRFTQLRQELENDATYGKANLAANEALAKRVIERVRPEGHPLRQAFYDFLNHEGAGNHLQVFAFLADLGKLMAEDKPPASGTDGAPRGQRDHATVLYGGQ